MVSITVIITTTTTTTTKKWKNINELKVAK